MLLLKTTDGKMPKSVDHTTKGVFVLVKPIKSTVLMFCIAILMHQASTANAISLTIGIPSTPDPMVADEIADILEQALSEYDYQVQVIQQPDSYLHNIREGYFDAFFAESHIGAWAIETHGFTAVARLSATLSYHLVASREKQDVYELRDLVGRDICSPDKPSLGYQFFQRLFSENDDKPTVLIVNPQRDVTDIVEQPCAGFVVDEQRYLDNHLDQSFITLARSPRFNHLGFFVNQRLSNELTDILQQTVLKYDNQQKLQTLTDFYTVRASWIATDNSDYQPSWQEWLPDDWQAATGDAKP